MDWEVHCSSRFSSPNGQRKRGSTFWTEERGDSKMKLLSPRCIRGTTLHVVLVVAVEAALGEEAACVLGGGGGGAG
jgi:hypothetical protein